MNISHILLLILEFIFYINPGCIEFHFFLKNVSHSKKKKNLKLLSFNSVIEFLNIS